MSSVSLVSALAGVLVAYATVLVLLAVTAGIGGALGFETSGISDSEWRDLGVGAAVALGIVLLASSFFGGYVAGRMSRRAGLAHGLLVFVLAVAVVAAIAAVASATADGDAVSRELRDLGIPTAADDWRDIGLFGGVGMVAAMLVGSLLGGMRGERWHGVLVTRALDPEVRRRGEADGVQHPRRDPDDALDLPAAGTDEATVVTSPAYDETTPAPMRVDHEGDETRITRLP